MSIIALVFVTHARVAQLVEHHLAKVRAAGSNPVSRFFDALEIVDFAASDIWMRLW